MLNFSELVRIYVCLAPTDMRKSFDSLAALVREGLGDDPLSGHLFVFRSRRGDADARSIEVSAQELSLILWDIDPASVKRQPRYQRAA